MQLSIKSTHKPDHRFYGQVAVALKDFGYIGLTSPDAMCQFAFADSATLHECLKRIGEVHLYIGKLVVEPVAELVENAGLFLAHYLYRFLSFVPDRTLRRPSGDFHLGDVNLVMQAALDFFRRS